MTSLSVSPIHFNTQLNVSPRTPLPAPRFGAQGSNKERDLTQYAIPGAFIAASFLAALGALFSALK